MFRNLMTLLLVVGLLSGAWIVTAWAVELDGIKCPVSNKPVKEGSFVEFAGGKVYFCCNGCPKAFNNNQDKFTAKAHHQLFATGQAKQTGCPKTGKKLNPDTAIDVDGVAVAFCCNGCKGWANKSKGDELLAKLFGKKGFEKGFKVGDEEEEDDDS